MIRFDLPKMTPPRTSLALSDEIISEEVNLLNSHPINSDPIEKRMVVIGYCLDLISAKELSEEAFYLMKHCNLVTQSNVGEFIITDRGAKLIHETYSSAKLHSNQTAINYFHQVYSQNSNNEVSDENLIEAFKGCSFGIDNNCAKSLRFYLVQACLKKLARYWNGHTSYSIMSSLGLVEDTLSDDSHHKSSLTEKGERFICDALARTSADLPKELIDIINHSLSNRYK